jgi:hypothetical protein
MLVVVVIFQNVNDVDDDVRINVKPRRSAKKRNDDEHSEGNEADRDDDNQNDSIENSTTSPPTDNVRHCTCVKQ